MNTHSHAGRPREPLLIGQRAYALYAYRHRLKTQLDIAARLNVALPRVQRFLVEEGLHIPPVHGAAAHTQAVEMAVNMYIAEEPVRMILERTGIVVSELYKALHMQNIPLRSQRKKRS